MTSLSTQPLILNNSGYTYRRREEQARTDREIGRMFQQGHCDRDIAIALKISSPDAVRHRRKRLGLSRVVDGTQRPIRPPKAGGGHRGPVQALVEAVSGQKCGGSPGLPPWGWPWGWP